MGSSFILFTLYFRSNKLIIMSQVCKQTVARVSHGNRKNVLLSGTFMVRLINNLCLIFMCRHIESFDVMII